MTLVLTLFSVVLFFAAYLSEDYGIGNQSLLYSMLGGYILSNAYNFNITLSHFNFILDIILMLIIIDWANSSELTFWNHYCFIFIGAVTLNRVSDSFKI